MLTSDNYLEPHISDFYEHFREYWGHLSSSPTGVRSDMLNFGYWPAGTTNMFDAQHQFFEKISGLLPGVQRSTRGLEIGCGIGGISLNMLKNFNHVSMVALDISAPQLALAQQNALRLGLHERFQAVHGDAMDLPLADAEFDFTLCIESTFHYEDKARFFAENYRTLKPGGYAVLADITCEDVTQIKYRRENFFESKDRYIAYAREAGFALVSEQNIGPEVFGPLYAHVVAFNRRKREAGVKYWSMVLNNYAHLAAQRVMGYDIFLLKKPH